MGKDADVVVGAVEIGEDEGHAGGREGRAEPTSRLARAVLHVEEAALAHQPVEGGQPRIHAVEHHLRLGDQHVMVADRLRVAGGVDQRLVPGAQLVPALCLAAGFQQPRHQRHHMLRHLVAVAGDIGGVVIDAAHAAVAERDVIRVAELPRHAMPQRDEFAVDAVQRLAMRGEETPAQRLGLVALRPVRVLGIGREAGEVDDPARRSAVSPRRAIRCSGR